jgi:hypothetical protein
MTRARLLNTGLPAPFERDPMTPVDRRAFHAEVAAASSVDTTTGDGLDPDDEQPPEPID